MLSLCHAGKQPVGWEGGGALRGGPVLQGDHQSGKISRQLTRSYKIRKASVAPGPGSSSGLTFTKRKAWGEECSQGHAART